MTAVSKTGRPSAHCAPIVLFVGVQRPPRLGWITRRAAVVYLVRGAICLDALETEANRTRLRLPLENGRKTAVNLVAEMLFFEFGALIVFPDCNYGICEMDTRTVDALTAVMISVAIRAPHKYVTESDGTLTLRSRVYNLPLSSLQKADCTDLSLLRFRIVSYIIHRDTKPPVMVLWCVCGAPSQYAIDLHLNKIVQT